MKTINKYISESILSSTKSGKYAITDEIVEFIQAHIWSTFSQQALEQVEVKFENEAPYAILHMKSEKSIDITLDNPSKKELDILQKLAGIYAECNGKYYGVSLEFKNSNNLVLDFSKFSKGTFCNNADLDYSIVFYKCKDISIKTLPTDFGQDASDSICIYDGSTIKSLPKDMGYGEIVIGEWAFTNKSVDDANLSVLEGSTFGSLKIDESYIALSDMHPKVMEKCRNGQYRLLQKYNERFEQIVNLKINTEIVCTWVLDKYVYAEYSKRYDAYIFNKK